MAISPGTCLGVYEVSAPLGSGGMGEVYRARDTRLGREVALKILPPTFSNDPERVARFQREAQLLAALNHPHIGAIYGLEDAGVGPGAKTQVLVLELVDGETLATRLSRGRIPLDESLAIAREIIDALEAAHERGIIHRDLKPSNIALTAEGRVKVLDFGLAKAMDPVTSDVAAAGAMHSPTLTFAATQAGVVLGTAAYMSPEQAKGRSADKRSDVWAFGCVLFEMLSGKRAFQGEDVSDTMAAVLRDEPPWDALPPETPAGLRSLLRRCLEKDRRARVPEISAVRFLLEDALRGGAAPLAAPDSRNAARAAGPIARVVPWTVAAAAVVSLAVVGLLWAPWRAAPLPPPTRLTVTIGADVSLRTDLGAGAVLSPDARTLAFVASSDLSSPSQLYVRRLDQLQAAALAGTQDASAPFFSPDGQWIAFFAASKLKKVAVGGGAAVTLTDAISSRGAVWTEDDAIIFTPTPASPLFRVSAAGGKPEPLTTLTQAEGTHRWPDALPGGRVLYTAVNGTAFSAEAASVVVRDPSGSTRVLVPNAYYARYVSSGHILYISNGTLFAAPIDPQRGELTGPGVPAVEAVVNNTGSGATQVAVSASGTLVYVAGETLTNEVPINWMDKSGKSTPLRAAASNWSNPAFAPDGRRLAMDIFDGRQADVWIYEWARDTLSRLTFDEADDQRPVWAPDGRRIAFSSRRGDKAAFNLYWQRADGTGEVQRLTESKNSQIAGSWHPSGKFLAFTETSGGKTGTDLMILPMEGDETNGWKPGKPTVFLQTPQIESSPMFSPDGRWIAYLSNETGRIDVYVRPFPGPGGKWQVSTVAADDPTWSANGREFFFASASDRRIMVAPYKAVGESFQVDKPQLWSDGRFIVRPRPPSRDFDLHPDGQRFAVGSSAEPVAASRTDKLVFVFNFADELRRLAPGK